MEQTKTYLIANLLVEDAKLILRSMREFGFCADSVWRAKDTIEMGVWCMGAYKRELNNRGRLRVAKECAGLVHEYSQRASFSRPSVDHFERSKLRAALEWEACKRARERATRILAEPLQGPRKPRRARGLVGG